MTRRSVAGALTGSGALVRIGLRRDRVKLPVWLLAVTAFVPYFYTVLSMTTTSRQQLQESVDLLNNAMGRVFAGPLFGLEHVTLERYFLGYTMEFLLAAAFMSILLVARHTRAEEQNGRAELVRAAVVGRHASLTAALVLAVLANAGLGGLIAVALMGLGFPGDSSLLFGAGVAATGLVFAGVTACATQLTEHSRAAGGLAAMVLGVAWALRAFGVVNDEDGGALAWLSPLAWPLLTRVLDDQRWWPLLLSVGFAVLATAGAYVLSARRDFGAGLLPSRTGRAAAPRWVRSVLALEVRLRRRTILWWLVVLFAAGLVYGRLGPLVAASADADFFGGGVDVLRGYLSLMVVMITSVVGAFAILAVAGLAQGRDRWPRHAGARGRDRSVRLVGQLDPRRRGRRGAAADRDRRGDRCGCGRRGR